MIYLKPKVVFVVRPHMLWKNYHIRIGLLAIGVDNPQHPTELATDNFNGMLESIPHKLHLSIMADNVQEYGNSLLHVHTTLPFLQIPMLF